MNTESNTVPDVPVRAQATPAAMSQMRLLAWCMRRELWENRSLYIAPLLVAVVVFIGHLISALRKSETVLGLTAPALETTQVMLPYSVAAAAIIAIVVVVGWFYCLDALHGERRDRSILFWKSLPVSDRITVLSKAAIPFVVMPVIAFVIITGLQAAMLVTSMLILAAKGGSLGAYWTSLTLGKMVVGLAYSLVTVPLWHAPVAGWFLLVSAWAQRVPFLWALLPPAALCVIEFIALGGKHFYRVFANRVSDPFSQAFTVKVQVGGEALKAAAGKMKPMPDVVPDPMKFLSNPDLWIGLVIAFVFIAACVQLRRRREPI